MPTSPLTAASSDLLAPFNASMLETPAPVVDLDRLERNLDRAASYAAEHGLGLRPHIKTHKTPWIAAEQLARGAIGITCATAHEAQVMSAVAKDILAAYPPVTPPRIARLLALPGDVALMVALDSTESVERIAAGARAAGRAVRVLIELDVGMGRVGQPDVGAAIALAELVRQRAPLVYAGIAFYPGHVREHVDRQDPALETLAARLRDALGRFRAAGVAPEIVSGGSTPTMYRTHELPGVTEFRPGTYVFNDRTTAAVGACGWDDCALTVVATVVSTAVAGQAVIDAGSKALGREPLRGEGEGFAALRDHPEVTVRAMSEEHGILELGNSAWRPEVGDVVHVVPNHVCIVVHLNDVLFGARSEVVERRWTVEARGRGF
ncbi:MAG TPA: alanine racemase [Gemmatimonadaceae bacterium]|nr:alanine racemase [Gemmatimonadaceae bacterium]